MADPKAQLMTFPLACGMDNVSLDEVVQPVGQGARVRLSRNTRLSKVPGMISKAPGATLLTSGLGSYCAGVVPIDGRESTAVFLGGKNISKRVPGSAIGEIVALTGNHYQQDGYVPASVESAGFLPGGTSNFNVACAYQASTGYTYYAWIDGRQNNIAYIIVCILARDGRVLCQDQQFVASTTSSPNSTSNFVGLSAIGPRVHVWHGESGTNRIYTKEIDLTADLKIQWGSTVLIYTSVSVPTFTSVALAYDADDNTTVYLACRHASTATSVQVLRIDVSGSFPSVAAQQTHAVGSAWDYIGLGYLAGDCVTLAVSRTSGSCNFYELNRTTLAQVWVATSRLYQGPVSCGFYYYRGYFNPTGAATRVFANSRLPTTVPTYQYGTWVEAFTTTGVVFSPGGGWLANQFLCGQCVTQKISAEEYYTLVPTVNLVGSTGSYDPTSLNFVSEPALEVYRSADYYMLSCVARIGTDRIVRYPGSNVASHWTSGGANSCLMAGSKMLITYLSENTEEGLSVDGYRGRYAWIDFGAQQPQFAYAPGGAAMIAGALPACWDGREVTEQSPLRAPILTVTGGGLAPAWSGTGVTYLFAAVLTWRDSTGRIHRSAPSNIVPLTGTGLTPVVQVHAPKLYRRTDPSGAGGGSHEFATIALYISQSNGLTLYAQNNPITGYYFWNTIPQPALNAFTPALYTDGSATQELANYCPNATKACAIVSDRAWLVDGEWTDRAYYSKPIVSGYAPEFNPDQVVNFPASAGKLANVEDWNGSPLFLSNTGLFTVIGEGPDALLRDPQFAAPSQLSDIPCTQGASVVKTPGGIVFVSGNRFVIFENGPRVITDIDALAYGSIVFTALFRNQQEVCFFTSTGHVYVYNWQTDGWSYWDQTVTGVTSIVAGAQVPTTGVVLYYGDSGELWKLDPETVSTTAQVSITTGWISFGGPQDANNFQNLLLHAKRAGAHGLQIQICTDYDGATVNTKTWSAAEIANSVTDSSVSLRYDVYPAPKTSEARVIQLTFTETGATGEAFQPIHCTAEVLKQPGMRKGATRQSARK